MFSLFLNQHVVHVYFRYKKKSVFGGLSKVGVLMKPEDGWIFSLQPGLPWQSSFWLEPNTFKPWRLGGTPQKMGKFRSVFLLWNLFRG